MPNSGKGTLDIWRFHQCNAVAGHRAGTTPISAVELGCE